MPAGEVIEDEILQTWPAPAGNVSCRLILGLAPDGHRDIGFVVVNDLHVLSRVCMCTGMCGPELYAEASVAHKYPGQERERYDTPLETDPLANFGAHREDIERGCR